MGAVPNLSLPPVLSCRPGTPCIEKCYAKKFYAWPNVKNAWDSNLQFYYDDRVAFFDKLRDWIQLNEPRRFRFFVGGDFPDLMFLTNTIAIARTFPDVSFLAFTKRYEYITQYWEAIPDNYNIVLSMWPGIEIPDIAKLMPTAWLSIDDRFQHFFNGSSYIKCCSNCGECGYSCWGKVSVDLPVMFDLHR